MDKFLILSEENNELNPQEIGTLLEDYEILQQLGKGGYGFVAKVKSKKNHKIYAMKMIDFDKAKDPSAKQFAMSEIMLIQGLNSPHIIKYYHNFMIQNKMYIIMDFMNNGDLSGYVKAYMEMNQPIPENQILELFYQCISALCYIHKCNIIHRDIKPQNLFMTETKDIKIGDFGISTIKSNKQANSVTIGTQRYMAPEMFGNQVYDSKIDVYALGCSFHLMCYFALPREIVVFQETYGPRAELMDVSKDKFKNLNYYSQDIYKLIHWMIERDPNKRPKTEDVLNYVKRLYNIKNKQNGSIACAYNCLYSYKNLTFFLEKQKPMLSQQLLQKPIVNSFIFYLSSITNINQEEVLSGLRDILIYNNSCFPDPGIIDPIDILKFLLEKIFYETNTGTMKNFNIYGNNFQIYLQNLSFIKSCILDYYFGTFETIRFCNTCKQRITIYSNYCYLLFDIDQALKIGIASNNYLLNYFINQNKMMINTYSKCNMCGNMSYLQETKKIFSMPYNLVIMFKGEKNNYNNQYISYNLNLNTNQLGLTTSPQQYYLKSIIKCFYENEQRTYVSLYIDPKQNQWFLSNGYTKQLIPNPAMHTIGDVVALCYCSIN